MSKFKHYTPIEKKIFLEILKEFKHVVEVKKSDSSTLHDKEVAWSEICTRYNESTMIIQERTVQQLKKLWANLKQTQRDILTKKKQACLATGGGPPLPQSNIDPDIEAIAPHIMKAAPVIFTSNITENAKEKAEKVLNISLYDNKETDMLHSESSNDEFNFNKIMEKKSTRVTEEQKKNEKQHDAVQVISDEEENNKENEDINLKEVFSTKRKQNFKEINMQRKTTKVEKNIVSDENVLKIQRIKQIIEEEKEIGNIRKVHENNMALMKENFSKELHALEVQAATAKAELAELQLQKEKMSTLDI